MASPFSTSTFQSQPIQASDAAKDYLRSLMLEKAVGCGHQGNQALFTIDRWLDRNGSKAIVSANIDRLKAEGFTGRTRKAVDGTPQGYVVSADRVPAGRYAIVTEAGATNELAFYKVDRPDTGKWAGYVFVKMIVGDVEQRMSRTAAAAVLAKIAEVGPETAMATYGHEIGECGMCGRMLTNDESRARGIGPVCAAKAGW